MKIKYLCLFLIIAGMMSVPLFAGRLIGKDNQPYLENGVEWQDIHFFLCYDPFIASFPTFLPYDPHVHILNEGVHYKSTYNEIVYTIDSFPTKPTNVKNLIKDCEIFYGGPGIEIIPVDSNQNYIVYMVDIIGENKIQRIVQARNTRYKLGVEGSDLSIAPLFFDKFRLVDNATVEEYEERFNRSLPRALSH